MTTDISRFRLIESAEKETRKASILRAKGWVLMGVGGLAALADIWGTRGSTLIFPATIELTGVCYRRWSVSLAWTNSANAGIAW